MNIDPTVAVHLDSDSLLMTLGDGTSIQFVSKRSAADLILREKLSKVTRSELQSLAARYPATFAGKSLTAPARGNEDEEVLTWKRVARVQERFRSSSEGWRWWTRFSKVNNGGVTQEILEMLIELADAYPGLQRNGSPLDWMSILQRAMADTFSTNVSALRSRIRSDLSSKPND